MAVSPTELRANTRQQIEDVENSIDKQILTTSNKERFAIRNEIIVYLNTISGFTASIWNEIKPHYFSAGWSTVAIVEDRAGNFIRMQTGR